MTLQIVAVRASKPGDDVRAALKHVVAAAGVAGACIVAMSGSD